MAKTRKRKQSVIIWIMLALVLVGTAVAFSAIFMDWINVKGEIVGGLFDATNTLKMQDLQEAHQNLLKADSELKYFVATQALAFTTVIALALSFVLDALKLFTRNKTIGAIGAVTGLIALVAGIMTVVFASMMCNEVSIDAGFIGKATYTLAVGMYLLVAGGAVGCIGAVGCAIKR